jgi:hypothetical protein
MACCPIGLALPHIGYLIMAWFFDGIIETSDINEPVHAMAAKMSDLSAFYNDKWTST